MDIKHYRQFKVVSVTPNHSNGTVTETMTNNNGEVLIRIGDSKPEQSNEVDEAFDARNVITESQPIQNNGVYDAFDAHHVIYTKHSSAIVYRSDRDPNTQSVRTRHIKKIRENGTTKERTTVDIDFQNNNVIDKQAPMEINYTTPIPKDTCFYCRKTVYQKEKMGLINGAMFHKQCFHCSACQTMLTFKNFCQNPNDAEDRRLYCKSHQPVPEQSKGHIDDKRIRDFINKPRIEPVNINIRGVPEAGKPHSIGPDSLQIQGPMHVPKLDMYNQTVRVEPTAQKRPFVDQNAVVIKTAMNAPRLDNYNQTVIYLFFLFYTKFDEDSRGPYRVMLSENEAHCICKLFQVTSACAGCHELKLIANV